MKILVICQYYHPEPFRISDICKALVSNGHEVTVVTGTPNYPEGEIYKGYENGCRADEVINGVSVHRCPQIPRKTGPVYRLLNYYSYAFSAKHYVKKLKAEFDVVFVNQLSPVMMAEPAISWAKRNSKRCVLYCLDLWPESLLVGGIKKDSLIYKFFLHVSKRIYRNVDRIMVSSRGFLDYFRDVLGMDADVISYLPQYAEEMFSELPETEKNKETVDFLFAGNVGTVQSVETIVDAAHLLKDDEKIRIHIVGSGISLENCQKKAEGLQNITFYGRRPLAEMPAFYAKADAMLITMEKNTVIAETLPGKVQSYLAAGKPVIGAIGGETARIINGDAKCGVCCDAEDAAALANTIRDVSKRPDLLAQYGVNARDYYLKHFRKEDFIAHLEKTLQENSII